MYWNRSKILFGLVLSSIGVSMLPGCSIENTRKDTFWFPAKVSTLTYDASRRGVFILRSHGNTYICPEPTPDVAVQYASAIGASLSASGNATGNIINPLGGVGSISGALSPDKLRGVLTSLANGQPQLNLSPSILTDANLAKAVGELTATLSFQSSQSQAPHQLAISDTLAFLRNAQFWSCINQANSGQYDKSAVIAQQEALEASVSALIFAELQDGTNQYIDQISQVHGKKSKFVQSETESTGKMLKLFRDNLSAKLNAARVGTYSHSESANRIRAWLFDSPNSGKVQKLQAEMNKDPLLRQMPVGQLLTDSAGDLSMEDSRDKIIRTLMIP